MAFTKYLVPAAALASTVLAQCSGSLTIQSTSDAEAIASCTTYRGSITIEETTTGVIAINGVQQITGNLVCNNATGLTGITSDQLNSIGGNFTLTDLTIMATLQFDSLTSVGGLLWVGLPALQGLNFGQGVSQAGSIYISNTQLNSLSGIDLTQVGAMDVNNNPYLSTVNVNDLKNVTSSLSFSANSAGLAISFPNMEASGNLNFRNVSSIDMPSLSQVNGNMGFYSNTFETFSAPNLTVIEGGLAFVDSPNLSNISMPMLKDIGGGLLIANNSNLDAITGFPKLQVIVGALDFAGAFSKVTLPALKDVRGGSNVQTSSNTDVCGLFNTDHSNGVIKGVNTCLYNKQNPDINPSSTSGGSSSSSTSTGAAASFNPSTPLTGLAAIFAAMLFI